MSRLRQLLIAYLLGSLSMGNSALAQFGGASPPARDPRMNKPFGGVTETAPRVEAPRITLPKGDFLYNIEVSVAGEVSKPGTFSLPVTSRLTEAIEAAGGLRGSGSKRSIRIERSDKQILEIDVFIFETTGELRHNPYLRTGDLVFVPVRKGTVEIAGSVRRPGAQELIQGKTAARAIHDSGGYGADFESKKPFSLVRVVDNGRIVMKIEPTEENLNNFALTDGDILIVPSILIDEEKIAYDTTNVPGTNIYLPEPDKSVYLVGAFARPGAYPYEPKLNLQRYTALAGGTTIMAKTKKAYLQNPAGQKERVDLESPHQLKPGDTVVVPEKGIPPVFWPSFILSIASFALTAFLAYDRIKN